MMVRRAAVFVLFMTIAFFAGLVVTGRMRSATESTAAVPAGPPQSPARAAASPIGGMPDLTGVAQRAISSVTNISSTQIVRTPNSPFANDPFFRFFFSDQDDAFGYRERRAQSLGPVVIVSRDGSVLTQNQVGDQGV